MSRGTPARSNSGPLYLMLCLAGALALGLTVVASDAAQAGDDIVIKTSTRSVKETIDALAAKLKEKGIKIAARVDHAAGAKAAGLELPPTELLIFGNPKLGTPLMQANRAIGLDLPMKVLAWQEADGTVKVAYTAPAALAKRHGISDQDKIVETMTKALDGLTKAAAGTQ
jgi:uncharacterized protein (DUF302 family)